MTAADNVAAYKQGKRDGEYDRRRYPARPMLEAVSVIMGAYYAQGYREGWRSVHYAETTS